MKKVKKVRGLKCPNHDYVRDNHLYNKMLKLGILTEVNDGTVRKGTRTPIKYSFNLDSYNQMKAKGFRLEF